MRATNCVLGVVCPAAVVTAVAEMVEVAPEAVRVGVDRAAEAKAEVVRAVWKVVETVGEAMGAERKVGVTREATQVVEEAQADARGSAAQLTASSLLLVQSASAR